MVGNYLPNTKWNKNVWHYLAERLSKLGWTVMTTSSKENKVLRLTDMLWTVWNKRKRYTIAQIDVLSFRAFIFAEACSWLLNALHKPIVLTLHGGKLVEFSKKYPARMKRVLRTAKVVVTPSPFLQTALAALRPDIRLIPNPIDLSSAIYRLRETVKPRLIWVRSFHRVYNPSLAPYVLSTLRPKFPDLHLWMLGPDKGDGSLAEMIETAKRLGVIDNIEVVGPVKHTEVPMWLDKADIFLNTTNYDTAPRSVLEAMANGLCVVSTDVGGISYIIDDGKTGLLVPPGDADAMASAIQKILTKPELAKLLSANAHRKAKKNDWSHILPQWEGLFSSLIPNP